MMATLVLGDPADPNAERFAGIDEFRFDKNGMVTVKKAWLKGIPRLGRNVIWRNPKGWGQQLRYLFAGIGV